MSWLGRWRCRRGDHPWRAYHIYWPDATLRDMWSECGRGCGAVAPGVAITRG